MPRGPIAALAFLLAVTSLARGQTPQKEPHIGYAFPAGGRVGATIQATIGGQYLDGVTSAYVSAGGVHATVVQHIKPLTQKQISELQDKIDEARDKFEEAKKSGLVRNKRGRPATFEEMASNFGVSAEDLKALEDFRKQRNDPKRQVNPQIAEKVSLEIQIEPNARPGQREMRLKTSLGLTNPINFHVGQVPEYSEVEPNDEKPFVVPHESLPLVLNGQILPGDVDRFRFKAERGANLVVVVSARELVPYLADAVPGWFQATLALYDGRGNEVKYVDDFLFHPDPVLYYKIPKTDDFTLVINDSIYRGREDFVYRVTVGEIPFVTSIFPRGGRNGESTTIDVDGWNLKVKKLTLPAIQREPGVQLIDIVEPPSLSNRALFAVDTLPEVLEAEPNDGRDTAQKLSPPLIVNGRIDRSGDVDVFHFEGRAGGRIVAEVQARRLNSPLDSWLELTDANGKQLAVNDDNEDRGSGLTTHHADARICFTLPEGGTHFIRLKDAQNKGGAAYAYRLRVSARRPDFELRAVPSSLNARVGTSVSFTVYALRRDEFTDAVSIALKDPPPGFVLSGGEIPAKKDEAKLTLKVPAVPTQEPVRLVLQGKAVIKGSEVTRPVIPAEDMMQAFIYRHLVTVEDLLVSVTPRASK